LIPRRILPLLAGAPLLVPAVAPPAASAQPAPPPRPFDPVGRWRFFHTDGTPFLARLMPDQTAATDWDGGERGIWRWEGNGAVRVLYTDGWDDLLSRDPSGRGGFLKRGWAPGADRCRPPTNRGRAERLSDDPGPPL
jgi:hypothetical protein